MPPLLVRTPTARTLGQWARRFSNVLKAKASRRCPGNSHKPARWRPASIASRREQGEVSTTPYSTPYYATEAPLLVDWPVKQLIPPGRAENRREGGPEMRRSRRRALCPGDGGTRAKFPSTMELQLDLSLMPILRGGLFARLRSIHTNVHTREGRCNVVACASSIGPTEAPAGPFPGLRTAKSVRQSGG